MYRIPHTKKMEKLTKSQILFFSFLIALVLLLVSYPAKAHEVEDEREFSYKEDDANGPKHWGDIHPEWRMCNYGTMQSPIDLVNERVEEVCHLGTLKKEYKPSYATLVNRGHDMMLEWNGSAGHIEINGTQYQLKQSHWHSPSEHTINGKRFDLEVHLVHESAHGEEAVVGIMYEIGQPDSFLFAMKSHLEAMVKTGEEVRVVGMVDPNQIDIASTKYYRYIGSLTTPPCTQDVVWTISRKVATITEEQLELLNLAVDDDFEANARPIQPINTRLLQLFEATCPDGN